MERSAGIAIVFGEKILMTHALSAPWYGSWMPPKGKIEKGETEEEAACREVEEECGIKIPEWMLGKRHVISYTKSGGGKNTKKLSSSNAGQIPLSLLGFHPS